jgi:hypothetical protein
MDSNELKKFIKGVVAEVMSETSTHSTAKSYKFDVYKDGKKIDGKTKKDIAKKD